jgi:exopolysaccharide biosynthesis polyprenyl glycosylphosphotransferase
MSATSSTHDTDALGASHESLRLPRRRASDQAPVPVPVSETAVRQTRRSASWPQLVLVAVPFVIPALDAATGAFHELRAAILVAALWWAWSSFRLVRNDAQPLEPAGVLRVGFAAAATLAIGSVAGVVPSGSARESLDVLVVGMVVSVSACLLARRSATPRRVVLVGTREQVDALGSQLSGSDVVVVGLCVPPLQQAIPVQRPTALPTVRALEDIPAFVDEVAADQVIVERGPAATIEDVRRLTWALEDRAVTVGIAVDTAGAAGHRVRTGWLGRRLVVHLGLPGASTGQRIVKSAIDRVGAFVLIVLSAPLLAALWLAVRLDSPGPGFFVQERAGHHGRPFRMFKLRTMCLDAEEQKADLLDLNESDGVLFKIREDPRVTRVGHLLRRSSLDELPQLFNVLRGEMSLVGPRPALPEEVESYPPDALRRLAVKPGITGLWQVSGRADLSQAESLSLDLHYTDNWRVVDDLAITARTVTAVTQARGAY